MNCTGQNRPYTPINGNNRVQVSEKEAPNNLLRPSLISDRHFSFCFSSLPTGWAHTRGEIADPNKNCKWRSVSSSTGGGHWYDGGGLTQKMKCDYTLQQTRGVWRKGHCVFFSCHFTLSPSSCLSFFAFSSVKNIFDAFPLEWGARAAPWLRH